MSRKLSIICTIILIAPACDEERAEPAAAKIGPAGPAGPAGAADDPIVGDAQVEAAGSCATLFEHASYGGDRREVNNGDQVSWIGEPWNDHVSSAQVRPGCVLNAYEHVNYGGDHTTLLGDVAWIGDGWNDRISSYSCTC